MDKTTPVSHLLIKINQVVFNKPNFISAALSQISVPIRKVPLSFFNLANNSACLGYFISYDGLFSSSEMLERSCANLNNWEKLVNSSADFFIIYLDGQNKLIYILTGPNGGFPCYFSAGNREFLASPSFKSIAQLLKYRTLNPGAALEYLNYNHTILSPDETIISEIKQLPPASLLTVNKDFNFNIKPLINYRQLLKPPDLKPFSSIAEFADELINTGRIVMRGYLKAINNESFAAELSSGLDSGLVCYLLKHSTPKPFICHTWNSSLMIEDTNPQIVSNFCRKHNLDNKMINISDMFPFCNDHDIYWSENHFFPADHAQEKAWEVYQIIKNDGVKALFTGHGGDELYGSHVFDNYIRFPVQRSYFHSVDALKWNIDSILTKEGINILLDRSRYSRKKFYPSKISPSALIVRQVYYPTYWESGIWLLMPLADYRLIKVAQRAPVGAVGDIRQLAWQTRKDIFLDSQFTPKGGPVQLVDRYLDERRELLIGILEKSVLGRLGLARHGFLIDLLKKGLDPLIKAPGISFYLHNLIRLELFLQRQNIT